MPTPSLEQNVPSLESSRRMKCPGCEAEVADQSAFCPQCGTRLDSEPGAERDRPAPAEQSGRERFNRAVTDRQRAADDAEEELWEGGFSGKAMLGAWIAAGVLSLVVLVVAAFYATTAAWWGGALVAIVVLWVWPALTLLYRRFNIHYRLTSQRLFHAVGIVRRRIDRIELLDVDDITYEQGLIERMLGVGTIQVTSSDTTHPKLIMRGIDQVQEVAAMMDAARRKERVRRGLHIESI